MRPTKTGPGVQHLVGSIFERAAEDLRNTEGFVALWGSGTGGLESFAALSGPRQVQIRINVREAIALAADVGLFLQSEWGIALAGELVSNPGELLSVLARRVRMVLAHARAELAHIALSQVSPAKVRRLERRKRGCLLKRNKRLSPTRR